MHDVDKENKQPQWVILKMFGDEDEEQGISESDIDRIEVREKQVEVDEIQEEKVNFNALIPVSDFAWEGYQSTTCKGGHSVALAKQISIDLSLLGMPQTFDLYTKDGMQATFNISNQKDDYNNYQHLFFIRKDLLKDYIKRNKLSLVWALWGEREYSYDRVESLFHGPNRPEHPYAVFSSVERLK